MYEETDPERGKFAARARHRVIAEIVWDRCADLVHKEQLPLQVIARLNLNFVCDKDAFDAFVQSDNLVDGIETFEKRSEFFEIACKRDPLSPYVRQHYSRMLARQKVWTSALQQIESGISLSPNTRVLYHTKGLILKQMALDEPGKDLARRRLVQSQICFEEAIKKYAKDEYAYHGLAELYFEWAQKRCTDDEALDYISKAETVVAEALKVVYHRDRLLVVSSRINEYLGDQPKAVAALERAVHEQPDSIVARYLLGRRYRISGRPYDSINILEPIIHKHFDEYRCFLEYALAKLDVDTEYSAVSAILNLSTRYGMRDARYISVCGGVLFMNGDFTGAQNVFADAERFQFSAEEERRILFRPTVRGTPGHTLRLHGKVTGVKAGYSFIEVDGYPAFFCHGSKHRGISLTKGMHVSFEPGFTVRGQIADNVQVIVDTASLSA